jgi:DNA invertase Pin-like site-specific DNA recombinase
MPARKAGLVLCLDASRLARNNHDWHQLLELCSIACCSGYPGS